MAEQRIPLDRGDYFELRARVRDLEVAKLEAEKSLSAALAAQVATFEAIAKKHDLDPTLNYRWDDKTCELIVVEKA